MRQRNNAVWSCVNGVPRLRRYQFEFNATPPFRAGLPLFRADALDLRTVQLFPSRSDQTGGKRRSWNSIHLLHDHGLKRPIKSCEQSFSSRLTCDCSLCAKGIWPGQNTCADATVSVPHQNASLFIHGSINEVEQVAIIA